MAPAGKRARTIGGGSGAAPAAAHAAMAVVEISDSDDEVLLLPQQDAGAAAAGALIVPAAAAVVVSEEERRKEANAALATALAMEAVHQARHLDRCQARLASLPGRIEAQLFFAGAAAGGGRKRGRPADEVGGLSC